MGGGDKPKIMYLGLTREDKRKNFS